MPKPALGAVDPRPQARDKDQYEQGESSPEEPRCHFLPEPFRKVPRQNGRQHSHGHEYQMPRQVHSLHFAGTRCDAGAVHHQDAEAQQYGDKRNQQFAFVSHGEGEPDDEGPVMRQVAYPSGSVPGTSIGEDAAGYARCAGAITVHARPPGTPSRTGDQRTLRLATPAIARSVAPIQKRTTIFISCSPRKRKWLCSGLQASSRLPVERYQSTCTITESVSITKTPP